MALALALPERLPPLGELPPELSSWLFLGEGAASRIALERSLPRRLERISTADSLQQHAAALRRPYIDTIGSLSLENASPEWWASELAAKSPYTRLFERVCALAVARELLGSGLDDCLVVCETPALLAEVESAAATSGVETVQTQSSRSVAKRRARDILAGQLISRLGPRLPQPLLNRAVDAKPWIRPELERSHTFRRTALASLNTTPQPLSGPGTALLLTWVDDRSVTREGAYADPHFGWLPEALRARGYRLAFLPRFIRTAGFTDLARRLIGTGEDFLFPELLVDEASLRSCRESAQGFSPAVPSGIDVSGVPFARLAREHVDEHRAAQEGNLVYRPLVEGLARAGVEPELLVHTFEGHAWEQVLADAVRSHLPRTRVVGFDNLNMTRLALSLFPATAELGLRPLPDRIVANGPTFKEVLVGEGVPEGLVAVGCAIRHAHQPQAGDATPTPASGRPVVLVATDASFDRAVELVLKAAEAFGADDGWELVVKCHPLIAPGTVESFVRDTTGFDGMYADRSIPELLTGADLMLYTYSSVCYEALGAGVPPVFVQAETGLDLDQLEPFPDLHWTGRTPGELRDAARAILDLRPSERAEWRARAQDAVHATLAPITSDCVEAFLT